MESFGDWPLFVQLAPFGSFICENEIISGYRVGHDGDKFRNRLGMWLRDEQRMFYEVMPFAADRLKWRIDLDRQGQPHNFTRYLASACHEYSPSERAGIVPLFQSWAACVRGEEQSVSEGGSVSEPITPLHESKGSFALLLRRSTPVFANSSPAEAWTAQPNDGSFSASCPTGSAG